MKSKKNEDYIYVALLDVLGYRRHLDRDRQDGVLLFKEKLTKALRIFDKNNEVVFGVQAISDTVIITCRDKLKVPTFLELLRKVFIAFLMQGLFVRGAIAYSRHFQTKYLTYSHAIARAHELESGIALYPRIVIDHNIITMHKQSQEFPAISQRGFLCKQNDIHFLEVLTKKNWISIYNAAREIYIDNKDYLQKDESAFIKHIMFERYLFSSKNKALEAKPYCNLPEDA